VPAIRPVRGNAANLTAGRFKPGQSGNPSGRPKQDERHNSSLAKRHTAEEIAALVKALQSPRERVPAAIALLDRGWGKPVQMIAADPERPLAVSIEWSDAGGVGGVNGGDSTPNAHTDTSAVRHLGQAIEAAIIDAAIEDDKDA